MHGTGGGVTGRFLYNQTTLVLMVKNACNGSVSGMLLLVIEFF